MNNIEILENFIDKQKSNKGTFVATDFEITALEYLIQENKDLKNKCNELNFKYTAQWVDDNFIPKSKVKEKIKDYDKMIKATYGDITYHGDYRRKVCFEIRQILQELLKGE